MLLQFFFIHQIRLTAICLLALFFVHLCNIDLKSLFQISSRYLLTFESSLPKNIFKGVKNQRKVVFEVLPRLQKLVKDCCFQISYEHQCDTSSIKTLGYLKRQRIKMDRNIPKIKCKILKCELQWSFTALKPNNLTKTYYHKLITCLRILI